MDFKVVIVGRPNVGKSSLFNRLTKSRNSIVNCSPGVTRDINVGIVKYNNSSFEILDTGGIFEENRNSFVFCIKQKVENAVRKSSIVIVMFDAKTGFSFYDKDLVNFVRLFNKPVLYVINKVDGSIREESVKSDFFVLGVNKLYLISAEHGYGVSELKDKLVSLSPSENKNNIKNIEETKIRISIVGKTNVGKSSLINSLLGHNRLITSEISGTTRDSIKCKISLNKKRYSIIDTAGIRRKKKVKKKIEKISIIKSLKSLDLCDVAIIVTDPTQGIKDQDIKISRYANERNCGIFFVINKSDLFDKKNNYITLCKKKIRLRTKFLNFAPIIVTSALTGSGVKQLFDYINSIYFQFSYRIKTGCLNRIIKKAFNFNPPPFCGYNKLKFYYASQVSTKPPYVVCFVNNPNIVHFSYKRYILNKIRENTVLKNTPIKILFKK